MADISFNKGFKTYTINGDENCTITFNPSDYGILARIEQSQKEIDNLSNEYEKTTHSVKDTEKEEILNQLDIKIREQINKVFNSDVCTGAFGKVNCLTPAGGYPIYINFLNAVIPIIKNDIMDEKKKADKNVAKYVNQVK